MLGAEGLKEELPRDARIAQADVRSGLPRGMPDDLGRRLRRLKRRVSRLQADALAEACCSQLLAVEGQGAAAWIEWRPWHLLDLLHLSLVDGRHSPPWEPVTQDAMIELMNLLRDIDALHPSPQFGHPFGAIKALRQIAFEQFWLQRRISWIDVGRVYAQFGSLDDEHPLARLFFARAGISLRTYLMLAYTLWAFTSAEACPRPFQASAIFRNLDIPTSDCERFFELVALPVNSAQVWLVQRQRLQNPLYTLFEPVPFVRRPIITVGGLCFLTSRRMVEHHLRGTQQLLAEWDSNLAGREGGKIQERYLHSLLAELGGELATERELKRRGCAGQVADFALFGDRSFAVLESKAIEPHLMFRINPSDATAAKYNDDLVDAFRQCIATACFLRARGEQRTPFAWVITRSDFYYVSGRPLWDEFLKDVLPPGVIAPENFFVTSIEEFEHIVGRLRSPQQILAFLQRMATEQADAATSVLQLSGKLPTADPVLPYVRTAFDKFNSELSNHFPQARRVARSDAPSAPGRGR